MISKTHRKICIGTITRDRPVMLQKLLMSYARLNIPEGIQICFLIVENNHEKTACSIINDFRARVSPAEVVYAIEPVLGIASARNHVLNYAADHGYDLLTFADDDEQVEPQWLQELLKERDHHNLDIVGAPVRFAPPEGKLSFWQRIVWQGVDKVNRNAENRSIKKREEGKAGQLKLATGSWMGNLDFFRSSGLRFDAALGQAGGEDWQLWAEAKALGAQTGWTPHAIAYETVPASRLKLSYYYRRNRDHARTVHLERAKNQKNGTLWRTFKSVLSRIYKVLVGSLLLPIYRERGLLTIAANLGSLVGFIDGARGKKSMHYVDIDGY
nr:glycosyltransferase family 2 protein [Ochrobactrum sp. SFR4]